MKVAAVAKLTVSILLSLYISGCGPDEKKDGQVGGKTPIKMWVAPNENEEAFWNKMVTEWNKDPAHTPVQFTPIPAANSSEEAIMNALASGTEPDISSNIFIGFASQLVDVGQIDRCRARSIPPPPAHAVRQAYSSAIRCCCRSRPAAGQRKKAVAWRLS